MLLIFRDEAITHKCYEQQQQPPPKGVGREPHPSVQTPSVETTSSSRSEQPAEFSLHPLNERCNSEQVSGDCWGMEFGGSPQSFAEKKRTPIDQIDYRSRIERAIFGSIKFKRHPPP